MPPKKPSPMELKRGIIRDYIIGGMARYGVSKDELAVVARMSKRNLYNRLDAPETFTVEELMAVFKKLHISFKIYRQDEDLL